MAPVPPPGLEKAVVQPEPEGRYHRERDRRSRWRCDVAPLGEATLVQSARHAYTGAWYVQAPAQYAGVAKGYSGGG
jgi:hypothetical protein